MAFDILLLWDKANGHIFERRGHGGVIPKLVLFAGQLITDLCSPGLLWHLTDLITQTCDPFACFPSQTDPHILAGVSFLLDLVWSNWKGD